MAPPKDHHIQQSFFSPAAAVHGKGKGIKPPVQEKAGTPWPIDERINEASGEITMPFLATQRAVDPEATNKEQQTGKWKPFPEAKKSTGNPVIQAKLRLASGSDEMAGARIQAFVDMLNTMSLGVFRYAVSADGFLAVIKGDEKKLAEIPPRIGRKLRVMAVRLAEIVNEEKTVTVNIRNGSQVIIGDFDTSQIDLRDFLKIIELTDMEKKTVEPIDFYTTVIHEFTEQFYKQVQGMGFDEAHMHALVRESEAANDMRMSERTISSVKNEDNSYTAVKEMRFVSEGGKSIVVTLRIVNSKVAAMEIVEAVPVTGGAAAAAAESTESHDSVSGLASALGKKGPGGGSGGGAASPGVV